jgi:hypothetical protein
MRMNKNSESHEDGKEGSHMKELPIPIAASLILMSIIFVHPKQRTFTGEIMDSHCGEVGSHGILNPLKAARECTINCVRFGDRYVLYDPTLQTAYGLDDQRRPGAFAGDKVEVAGTLDKLAHTIHVIDIQPAQ